MDQHQREASDQNPEETSPLLLTQSFAVIRLDENPLPRNEQNTQLLEASASVLDLSNLTEHTPTTPERNNDTTVSATSRKDVFDVLPPEIIDHVLSFLPIPTLFECTVLSRRWSKRVLPKLWHAPFMIYYVSWTKLLQHLSTCPLPLCERGEANAGGGGGVRKEDESDHGSEKCGSKTATTTTAYPLTSPPLSPDESPPLAYRRLSSQFTSSSCSSSTTSYLYRFPTLDRLTIASSSHHHDSHIPSSSSIATSTTKVTAPWSPEHNHNGFKNGRRRHSLDDEEQQDLWLAAILGGVPRYAHYIRILDFSQLHYLVSDRLLTSLIAHTPFLTTLIISAPKQLSDDTLLSIASSAMLCRHLRWLELQSCRQITDKGMSAIVQHCSQLETVRLGGGIRVTDKVVSQMAHLLSRTLRRVDFSNAIHVTGGDPGLMSLAVWCQRDWTLVASTTEPSLSSYVDPSSCTMLPPLNTLTTTIATTITAAAGLVDCRFSGCQGVTDELIERLSNLEILHVANCSELTDRAMMSLATRSPGLIELDITACWAITERGICAVGRGCQKLKRLILEVPEDEKPWQTTRPQPSQQPFEQQTTQQEQTWNQSASPPQQETQSEYHVGTSSQTYNSLGISQGSPASTMTVTSTVFPVGSSVTNLATSHSNGGLASSSSSASSSLIRPRISRDTLRAFPWGEQVLQRRAMTHGWRSARIF
ncbi:putative VIER F-box protein 1 [Actinomortierella wolfii]|nr:putative VIER F-box protein 1 [Actinomortierella wolfii]